MSFQENTRRTPEDVLAFLFGISDNLIFYQNKNL
jgi:hypothetical protein